MIEGLSDTNMMRIGIGVVALLVFVLIVYSSRTKRSQGGPAQRAAVPSVAQSLGHQALPMPLSHPPTGSAVTRKVDQPALTG